MLGVMFLIGNVGMLLVVFKIIYELYDVWILFFGSLVVVVLEDL